MISFTLMSVVTVTVSLEVVPEICDIVTSKVRVSVLMVPCSGAMNEGVAVFAPVNVTNPESAGMVSTQAKVRAALLTPGMVFLADRDTREPGRTVISAPASAWIATGGPPAVGGTTGGALSGQILDGVGAGKRPNDITVRIVFHLSAKS
jgi:hypothetical protein